MAIPGDKIEHLIILTMENRSFDHFLGALSIGLTARGDVDGLANARTILDADGNPIAIWHMNKDTDPNFPDMPHSYADVHADYNNGLNDGFVKTYQAAHPGTDKKNIPMGYYGADTLSVLYALAEEFTICDHWFASVLSSTWPNRKYLLSGRRDDDKDTQTIPIPGFQTTPFVDYLETQRNPYTHQPLTWKSYFTDVPFLAFWYRFTAFHLNNFAPINKFLDDCREDRLPTISLIDPPFTLADDHPPHDPRLGEKFIGLVVDALSHSESWAKSVLVIVYDECGGFYDHIPPPPAPETVPLDTPLGFRVPAIIVSPYSRKKYVSKTTYDHTSIMRSISEQWDVPFARSGVDFGTRFASANAIWDCFDFNMQPRPIATYTGTPILDMTFSSGVRNRLAESPLQRFESLLERIFVLPELKALDKRAAVFDNLSAFEQSVITLKRIAQYS